MTKIGRGSGGERMGSVKKRFSPFTIAFDSCFPEGKIRRFLPWVEWTVVTVAWLMGKTIGPLGAPVRCMTKAEIREGKRHGAGHGLYYVDRREIRINRSMPWKAIYLNFIHELAHHADLAVPEVYINDYVVPQTYHQVTGVRLSPSSWRPYRSTNPEGGCVR